MKRYFNRLTIFQKFISCSVIFALPIFMLLIFMLAAFNYNIKFTRLEIWGCNIIKPLEALVDLTSEHQLQTRLFLQGDISADVRINELTLKMDEMFSVLGKEMRRYEKPLRMDEKNLKAAGLELSSLAIICEKWQNLKAGWKENNSVQNDYEHETILQGLYALLKRVAETSNIVLDTELDSYYMVDAAILTMTRSQKRLSEFILYGESVLFKDFRSRDDVANFQVFTAFMESNIDSVKRSIATALIEDKNFYGESPTLQKNIPPLLEEYESAAIPLLVILKRFANDPGFNMAADDFFKAGIQFSGAGTRLQRGSIDELQILLHRRLSSYEGKRFIALVFSLTLLSIAAFMVFYITRGITKPLGKVIDIAGDIAGGNLGSAAEKIEETSSMVGFDGAGETDKTLMAGGNEVSRLFASIRRMTQGLESLLGQVRRSGIQVTTSSTLIVASARELESMAVEQAAATNEVNVSSKEIASVARELSQTMAEVTTVALDTAKLAEQSVSYLARINSAMTDLRNNTEESSKRLAEITEGMIKISQVILLITKIANRTNLLSLNAAIEAEKAGEAGIGFSVVAREIRRLADQTAVAAMDIEETIIETLDSVEGSVLAVENYNEQTDRTSGEITRIIDDLGRVIEHTQRLAPQFESVSQGVESQSQGAVQISEAMGQLSEAARHTRDSLAEFNKAAEQLNEAVRGLQDEVSRFSVHS